jgi:isocitrate dehydrogenase
LAGKDLVNPVALIQVGVLLLRHLGLFDQAALIENALLFTLEKGLVRTRDFAGNLPPVGTQAFTQAVLGNFGRKPSSIQTKSYRRLEMPKVSKALNITGPEPKMSEAGVDIFVQCAEGPAVLGQALEDYAKGTGLRLRMISNRGVKVYPGESKDVDLVDHYRCRFVSTQPQPTLAAAQLAPLLEKIESRWRWMHVEKLPVIDGALGFTRAHGEE